MNKNSRKSLIIFLIIFIIVLIGGLIALVLITKPMPVTLLQTYGLGVLWHEGVVMNECGECHDAIDFHSCETCHDDHGAVELANVPFSEIVELTGDVPDPSFVRVNQILPDQEKLGTHIIISEFLKLYEVDEFESITFITNDGGLTTIESQYLDETSLLVPYIDGVRFITESVHSSTWLKGIQRIVIVSREKPLTINGKATSIGRLLLGETVRLTVEGSDVMLTDKAGQTSRALVANWAEGARLLPLLDNPSSNNLVITDKEDITMELTIDEVQNAIIAIVRDKVTLILPERGRSAWPTDIISIEVQ